MHALPFVVTDPEPEQALEIVVNYLERKYGDASNDTASRALMHIYAIYKKQERRPLVIANKVITLLERQREAPRAA
jgi:hypothetical protein